MFECRAPRVEGDLRFADEFAYKALLLATPAVVTREKWARNRLGPPGVYWLTRCMRVCIGIYSICKHISRFQCILGVK